MRPSFGSSPIALALTSLASVALGTAAYAADPGPFLGPMHEAHGGQVIFSSKPVTASAATDDGFITGYKLGDPLYVRMWGKDSANNTNPKCRRDIRYSWRVTVNGGEDTPIGVSSLADDTRAERAAQALSGDAKIPVTTATTIDKASDDKLDRVRGWNGEVIPQLVDGKNSIHVRVTVDCGAAMDDDPTIAEGTLEVDVEPGRAAAYAKAYGPFLPKARHPESKAIGPKLAAAVAEAWANEDILGAVLTSPGWTVVRDEWTGAHTRRWSEGYVVAHLKKERAPNRCRAFAVTANEAAMNTNRFSPDVTMGGSGSPAGVPCAVATLPGR